MKTMLTATLLTICLSLVACGGEPPTPDALEPNGTSNLAGGNRWTLTQAAEDGEELTSRASALESSVVCTRAGQITTSPTRPCCNSARALGRREYRYYCCYGSGGYNAGSAALCCSGGKGSGNYCF